MGDLTSFLAVVVCVRSPFFRVKWLILPGQPVTPRKRYSIGATRRARADSRPRGQHGGPSGNFAGGQEHPARAGSVERKKRRFFPLPVGTDKMKTRCAAPGNRRGVP